LRTPRVTPVCRGTPTDPSHHTSVPRHTCGQWTRVNKEKKLNYLRRDKMSPGRDLNLWPVESEAIVLYHDVQFCGLAPLDYQRFGGTCRLHFQWKQQVTLKIGKHI
jgi:hypothetical protein